MDKRTPEVRRTSRKIQGSFLGHITLQGQQGPGAPAVSGTSYVPHILDPCFVIESRILSLGLKQGSRSGMRGLKVSRLATFVIWRFHIKTCISCFSWRLKPKQHRPVILCQPVKWKVSGPERPKTPPPLPILALTMKPGVTCHLRLASFHTPASPAWPLQTPAFATSAPGAR